MSGAARAAPPPLLALAAVLIVAVGLRLAGLDYSLWNDEVASTMFAGAPVHLLWSDWMVRETNPPLYYTLLHGWTALAGGSDPALRFLSVMIGCAALPLVYALGRRVAGAWTGVLAAALVAASAQNILYSQQVRGYILAYLGAVAAVHGAIQLLDAVAGASPRVSHVRALALYVAGAAVAMYAHTTLVLLPALTGAFVLARLAMRRAGGPAAAWLGANALLLLFWAWWARITWLQAHARATIGWIATPSLPYAVRMTLESWLPWEIGPAQYLVALGAVAAAAAGAWRLRARPDHLLLPFLAVALPALLLVLSMEVPVFLDRTVYWGSAPFLVTAAAGIAAIRVRAVALAAAGAGLAASLAGWAAWFPQREIEPWRGVVAAIERQRPGAVVLVDSRNPALDLQRYCRPPACSLAIRAIASPATDTWTSGFAVPGMIGADGARALLSTRGSLVTVRWMDQDAQAVLPPGAPRQPLVLPPVHAGNIAATLAMAP